MLNLEQRILDLEKLGRFISQYKEERKDEDLQRLNEYFLPGYRYAIEQAYIFNNWFTPENIHHALEQWSQALTREHLQQWVKKYPKADFEPDNPKTIAVIMAGNLPLVGFHDFLTILLSGHKVLAKPSSEDEKLLPYLAQVLVAINRDWANRIEMAEEKIQNFDAVIATGSDNSARYFHYYFGKYPHIIRKNRSSVAMLTGDESKETLQKLGEDVFRYFGRGCRNVSKAYVPKGYDPNHLFEAFYDYKQVIDNNKYGNNYDYNRAIYLMEKHEFWDNGFFIIKKNPQIHAPVAVLHLEEYEDSSKVEEDLKSQAEELQCIVSEKKLNLKTITPGQAQKPQLWDYADKADTVEFLQSL